VGVYISLISRSWGDFRRRTLRDLGIRRDDFNQRGIYQPDYGGLLSANF